MQQAVTLPGPLDGPRKCVAQAKLRAGALWRDRRREATIAGLAGLLAATGLAVATLQPDLEQAPVQARPPAPPPLLIRQIAPEQALEVNEQIPMAHGPNPAAQPFRFAGDKNARAQALECLTSGVYYEAGSQGDDGERAVAQVILNRVRHPAFPASVCGVVYQGSTRPTGCQFTFTCDGSMYRAPDAEGWKRARRVAEAALGGYVYAPIGLATHYHADYVVPYWASTLAKSAVVGAHIFYRWAGGWGQPAAFVKAYAGHEPSASALRTAALAAVHVAAGSPSSVALAVKDIPGAEAIKLAPSLRGDKRVAVRFNLVARKAADEAQHVDYTRKFEASDNLKFALSDESVGENQAPLGKSTPPAPSGTAAGQR